MAPLDLINVNSASPGNPLGNGRAVLFAGSRRESPCRQILGCHFFKADRHDIDSRPSTSATPFRLHRPPAKIGVLLNLLSFYVKDRQLTLAAHIGQFIEGD